MNSIRKSIRKLPPSTAIKLLRKIFSAPAPAARLILNDVTRPRKIHKPWIHKVKWNEDWSGCWIGEKVNKISEEELNARIHDADIVFFFVHGGGFRIGSCTMYMDTHIAWINTIKEKYGLKCMIMSIDYRLAPEYRYPSPIEDVVRAYEYLILKLDVDSEKVIVLGDSAGSSLVLEMLFITHDPSMFEIVTDDSRHSLEQPALSELPRPAGTILISPLVTDKTNSESWRLNTKYDYISLHTAKVIKRDYFQPVCKDEDAEEARSNQLLGIAKLQTGFSAFMSPEVLLYVGNKEVLRDDALDLAMKAERDGVIWQTVIEDEVHDWFCVREVVRDQEILRRADETFADFCYRVVTKIDNRNTMDSVRRVENDYVRSTSFDNNNSVLAAVKEEDEDIEHDDDIDDDIYSSTPSSSSMFDSIDLKLSNLTLDAKEGSSKRSSDIVFV
ncbi:Alpha/Beta hydrolase protein [Pilobolus umbonatus]|nr:Alpha/Beta hydrolase protein [Pilobolus umbonatus]